MADVLIEVLPPAAGKTSHRVQRILDGAVAEDRWRRSASSARELAESMRQLDLDAGHQVEVRGAGKLGRPVGADGPRRTCSVKLAESTWAVLDAHASAQGMNRSRALEDLVRRGSIGCCCETAPGRPG